MSDVRLEPNNARIEPLGDAAVLVTLAGSLNSTTLQAVWRAYAAIRQALAASVIDIVPAYASIVITFDPGKATLAAIMAAVRGSLERPLSAPKTTDRRFMVGVCFAPEFAFDLADAASEVALSQSELVDEFCAAAYRVAFLGFTAGFPYLLGLSPRLRVSRLASPRTQVPSGSVGIAGGQCGIYPRATPGGWKILGRTSGVIFDPQRDEPALFRPGDRLQFTPAPTLERARISLA